MILGIFRICLVIVSDFSIRFSFLFKLTVIDENSGIYIRSYVVHEAARTSKAFTTLYCSVKRLCHALDVEPGGVSRIM